MRNLTLPVLITAIACFGSSVAAQCWLDWTPTPQQELFGHSQCSLVWDSDGAGPLPTRLFVGGSDLRAGSVPASSRVVAWDGISWDSLGAGSGPGNFGEVRQLEVWNGELFAAGTFTGGSLNRIARWDGAAWQPLGVGFPVPVAAMAVFGSNLIVVGSNSSSGPLVVQAFNGSSWTTLPSPPQVTRAFAAKVYRGELIVAGLRSTFSGSSGALERWNGSSWAPSIPASAPIYSLAIRTPLAVGATPILYVGGAFTSIGGGSGTSANYVATTTGGPAFSWSQVASGLSGPCVELLARNSGLTGFRLVAQVDLSGPMTWVGSGSWTPMGSGSNAWVNYYAGAYHGGGWGCNRYDGTAWVPLRGPGLSASDIVFAITRSGPDVIVGGVFGASLTAADHIIGRWNGTTLTPLGTDLVGEVRSLVSLDNGDIIAGGSLSAFSSTSIHNIARWNGTNWLSMGLGTDSYVTALCKLPNGDVVAGGAFSMAGTVAAAHVARWDGVAWSPMGSGLNASVEALAVDGSGRLFAGGSFQFSGGVTCSRIARWNGTQWVPVGSGMNDTVRGLAIRPNGDVVAVGSFTLAGQVPVDRCALWNGSVWLSTGADSGDPAPVHSVQVLPNGDVIAGRGFHQPTATTDSGISRWNGSTWSGLGGGIGITFGGSMGVCAMAQTADGDLVVGGQFQTVAGFSTSCLASLRSTCMPTAVPYGAGCMGTAGPLVLTADDLPWLGGVFHTTTTGIAAFSLCLRVIGFAPTSLTLGSLLPQGQPGCTLLTLPDVVDLLLPTAGELRSQLVLAASPSLLGGTFHQQTIPCEIGALGALIAVRSSNALTVTIGTL